MEEELDALTEELQRVAGERGIKLGERLVEDVLIYAQFPQIGLKFLENRGNPDAFEPAPGREAEPAPAPVAAAPGPAGSAAVYTVTVNGHRYVVEVAEGGDVAAVAPAPQAASAAPAAPAAAAEPVTAPLAGNIFKVQVGVGDSIAEGDVIVILEAMKMETEVRATRSGTVATVDVKVGDTVAVGDTLVSVS
jgi:oxaloacetate decarboxylase alpha subunit